MRTQTTLCWIVAAGLVATQSASGASAAEPVWSHGRPGLWAITTQIDFEQGGPKIPPEQIAQMRLLGMMLPFGEPVTSDVCISAAQAADDQPPTPPQNDASCQILNIHKQGLTYSGDLICSGDTKGKGHFESTYVDDKRYDGTLTFKGVSKLDGVVATTTTFSGKWLRADCGSAETPNR